MVQTVPYESRKQKGSKVTLLLLLPSLLLLMALGYLSWLSQTKTYAFRANIAGSTGFYYLYNMRGVFFDHILLIHFSARTNYSDADKREIDTTDSYF